MGSRTWMTTVIGVVVVIGLIWGGRQAVRINDELTGDAPLSVSEIDEARSDLLSRGSYEDEAEGKSIDVVEELRSALQVEFGSIVWNHDPTERSGGACSSAEQAVGGVSSEYSRSLGFRTLDAEEKARAVTRVGEVSARHGFVDSSTIISGDGSQRVDDLRSPGGGVVTLVLGDRVGVSATTDCHLAQEQINLLRSQGY